MSESLYSYTIFIYKGNEYYIKLMMKINISIERRFIL
jgi:hypothetical protein